MKIFSPLDKIEEVEPLIEAGVEEFYCGVLEETWYNPYPVISINRRPAGKGHIRNFEELRKTVDISHRNNVPIFFTLNEHYYIKRQLPILKEYIKKAVGAGVDALIISDYGLLAMLPQINAEVNPIRKSGRSFKPCQNSLPSSPPPEGKRLLSHKLKIHLSTGGTVFNWRTAKFYQELGACRITLPRHLTLKEMKDIVKRIPELETTVFVFNSRCINIDGFCTFQHGLSGKQTPLFYRNACMLPYDISCIAMNQDNDGRCTTNDPQMIARQRIWELVHLDDYPCAACALYEFNRMGITSLKIVGRGNPTERKIKDVTFFRTLINHLHHDRPKLSDFRNYARKLYNKTYNRPCRPFMCHYPSVME
jgi:collagenase-like PrtC family protease